MNNFTKGTLVSLSALFSISSMAAVYHCPAPETIIQQCFDTTNHKGCRSWVSSDGLTNGVLWQGYTLDGTGSDQTKITHFIRAAWYNYFPGKNQGIMYCWYAGTDNAIIRFAPQNFSEKAQEPTANNNLWQVGTIYDPPQSISASICTAGDETCQLKSVGN